VKNQHGDEFEPEKAYWNAWRISVAALIVIAGVVFALLASSDLLNKDNKVLPKYGPDIRVMNVEGKETCQIFSGCVFDVSCELQNIGTSPGLVNVEIHLYQDIGDGVSQQDFGDSKNIYLKPGERTFMNSKFHTRGVGKIKYKSLCKVAP